MPTIHASHFWRRLQAFALDYLLIAGYLLVLAAAGMTTLFIWPSLPDKLFAGPVLSQLSGFLLVTAPVSLYFVLMESSRRRATWGKARLGLRVIDVHGQRLSFPRALGRTVLKFIPWELAHASVWRLSFAGEDAPAFVYVALVMVWVLAGVYALSLLFSQTRQTVYDRLSGTMVVASRDSA